MKPLYFLLFTGLLAALCKYSHGQEEAVLFCGVLESALAEDPSNPLHPRGCTVDYCTTAGAAFKCPLQTPMVSFVIQFTMRLCTDPPRLDLTVTGNGRVGVQAKLTESAFVTGTAAHANVTFNVLNNAIIEFGVDAISGRGDNEGAVITHLVPILLPYSVLMCPANISGTVFDCPGLDTSPTTTVHRLKPNDIKVIGAIGDSLTAGYASLGSFIDYRGIAFSGGGYGTVDQVGTLPNYLKEYRPDLVGFSSQLSDPTEESLNVGVVDAETINITTQIDQIFDRIHRNPDIDFENDWKLITLLIGFNDICEYSCLENAFNLVGEWIERIDRALTMLSHFLPRTFVNVMSLGKISNALRYVSGPLCTFVYQTACPCIGQLLRVSNSMPDRVTEEFNERLTQLVESRKYDRTNEFTVVIQPGFPLLNDNEAFDSSYLAIDCLHLAAPGNRLTATHLWNNMLSPVGSKNPITTTDIPPNCPAQDFPYLYTYLNSAECPPLCTHKFCSAKETRRADCTLPGAVSMCNGKCQMSSCRACYYSKVKREVPQTTVTCPTYPGSKCSRQWVTQVRRENFRIHGKPERHLRSQEFFRCFQIPCPQE